MALGRRVGSWREGGTRTMKTRGGWEKGDNEKTALTTSRGIAGTDLPAIL